MNGLGLSIRLRHRVAVASVSAALLASAGGISGGIVASARPIDEHENAHHCLKDWNEAQETLLDALQDSFAEETEASEDWGHFFKVAADFRADGCWQQFGG